jgi:histidine ammonia-lyase
MGMTSALKLQQVLENVRRVLGIELMVAAQALDFRKPLVPGAGVAAVWAVVRSKVEHLREDRLLMKDLAAMDALVASGAVLMAAREASGPGG